ncbi:carboxypeptidase-like regulatory domain-containing protein, partial [Spirosoma pomorum]
MFNLFTYPRADFETSSPEEIRTRQVRRSTLCLAFVLGLLASVGAYAQTKIAGRVVDDQQQGLPGVSVVVKNTTVGAVTDADGRYSINLPDKATALVFSYIGYISQEVPIGGKSSININMAADTKSLNEVVVVGYGTQRKETITGS